MAAPGQEVPRQFHAAVRRDDVAQARQLLEQYPELKAKLNDPAEEFDSPVIPHVRSKEMLDLLLDAGADIDARSRWWAGGFGLLDTAPPGIAEYAITRGAAVTVHAAARLGMLARLKELVEASPALVHARGGDGQTPLHFASTIEIAEYLLSRGAGIDGRDVDHVSTPAQYMVKDRREVARYLVERGCETDLLMASALGDLELAARLLAADPECIRVRVSDEYFPLISPKNGGTIYQWQLGWHVSACQVAQNFGHLDLFRFLMDRCPAEEKLLNACWLHDDGLVRSLLAQYPDLAARLTPAAQRHVAHAARNNDLAAARLMLESGFPAGQHSQHHATALHWAAFHGNAGLIQLLVGRSPIDDKDNEYESTPLGWAIYGSEHGWFAATGDYARSSELLLEAGAGKPAGLGGTEAVRTVLRRFGVS